MSDNTSPWALAWENVHKRATISAAILVQGYNVYRAGGVPAALDCESGQISAVITPRHGEPTRTSIRLPVFSDRDEQALTDALAAGPFKGAVLQGQLPAALCDPADTGEVPVMPDPGQITFACDCQQAPCQHTAALGHALGQRLAATPSLLLTLRGLPHRRLTALLDPPATASPGTAHIPPPTAAPSPAGPYVPAHLAYQHRGQATSATPRQPTGDGRPAADAFPRMSLTDPPEPAPPLRQLHHLVAQAARQAAQLLTDGTILELDATADAVRLAASLPAQERTDDIAHRLGLEPPAFRRLLQAYSLAGAAGVHTARHRHAAEPGILQRAAAAITALRPETTTALAISDNRITDPAADIEIRLGQDGGWYPFAASGQDWQLISAPAEDPAEAYGVALTTLHARSRPVP
ncbi:hypothetical protein [Streptacidiphilus sp. EB103A]|uniref:hypothetical protein n=1 Tax=Streptacidiphilus sp. EB103A TaxID=3156275 RepID=UPI003518D95E